MPISIVITLIGCAAILTWAITPLVRSVAMNAGMFDRPTGRKVHVAPTPLLGGIALLIGMLATLGIGLLIYPEVLEALQDTWCWIFLGAALVVLGGMCDDAWHWPPAVKLVWQIASAMVVCLGGIHVSVVTNPVSGAVIVLPAWVSFSMTIVWLVAIINAMNLMDGLDGLAAGMTAVIAIFLLFIAYWWDNMATTCVLAVLVGSCVGFLRYNWPPARIFMGDAGSQLLGLLIGVVPLLEFQYKAATAVALMIPLTTLVIPFSDVGLAIIRRLQGRRSIFRADKQHLHHRLLDLGLSQQQVIILMYVVTAYLGVIAILFVVIPEQYAILLLIVLAIGLFIGMRTIGFIERRLRYIYLQQAKRYKR